MANKKSLLVNLGQGLSIMLGFPSVATWKTSTRPKKAKKGTLGFNTQTNNLEYWDGSSWWSVRMS